MSEQQQHKAGKELQAGDASLPASSSSATSTTNTRLTATIHEMRNQEFVTRLMAATPPYLYSAPMGPNNFFFSDMLRSYVAVRNQKNARNLQLQQTTALAKRCRKRTWSQYRTYFKDTDALTDKSQTSLACAAKIATTSVNEKPLELTTYKPAYSSNAINDASAAMDSKNPKSSQLLVKTITTNQEMNAVNRKDNTNSIEGGAVDSLIRDTPSAASLPPQDLVLPPPPPVWYPSLYSPYGIDPLHFFIDLRVSGQVCDRKKENISPLSNSDGLVTMDPVPLLPKPNLSLFNKNGLGSAFSVPQPRSLDLKTAAGSSASSMEPNNLDSNNLINPPPSADNKTIKFENYAKYYDFGVTKEHRQCARKYSANYMLQHLPQMYTQLNAHDFIVQNAVNNNENADLQNKAEADCDVDSDEPNSTDNYADKDDDCYMSNDNIDSNMNNSSHERDVDVEYIDTVKYHRNADKRSPCNHTAQRPIT